MNVNENVSHLFPYGYTGRSKRGIFIGSKQISRYINAKSPVFVKMSTGDCLIKFQILIDEYMFALYNMFWSCRLAVGHSLL